MPDWAYGFLAAGIVFGLLVGCGLMALAFYSSRRGYDQPSATQQQKENHDREDRD